MYATQYISQTNQAKENKLFLFVGDIIFYIEDQKLHQKTLNANCLNKVLKDQ